MRRFSSAAKTVNIKTGFSRTYLRQRPIDVTTHTYDELAGNRTRPKAESLHIISELLGEQNKDTKKFRKIHIVLTMNANLLSMSI